MLDQNIRNNKTPDHSDNASQHISINDLQGPRYTSYPTALQFHEEFTATNAKNAIEKSNKKHKPLSIYIHIPFCEHVCYYCACNRIITGDKKKSELYLQSLYKEIDYYAALIDNDRSVTQMHWGGGTPTYLSDAQMTELMHKISRRFNLSADNDADFSIEIDPRTINEEKLALIKGLGFNRISYGIQDLDPDVQKAINRIQSEDEIQQLTSAARALDFRSINYDLIYGLPNQSVASLNTSLEKIAAMEPDRVSLYAYAHLPERFKIQRQIHSADLPSSSERLEMLKNAISIMRAHGYVYIGMDHFAKPSDSLAKAQASGDLHRNFQGYSTCSDTDLLAFGCSAISKVGNAFWQNDKTLNGYNQAIDDNEHALERGYTCSEDDHIRAKLIENLLCSGEIDIPKFEQEHHIDFANYFAAELTSLKSDKMKELVEYNENTFKITPSGHYLARRICLVFDIYNHGATNKKQFSRIV